jgi:predicted DNA-binding transcriptional regulator AlpA
MSTLDPLLTAQQVADHFGVKPAAIYQQRLRGMKPGALGISLSESKIRWRASDIAAWIDQLAQDQQAV